jgi:hypothetical protein
MKFINWLLGRCECGGKFVWDSYHDVCNKCGRKL